MADPYGYPRPTVVALVDNLNEMRRKVNQISDDLGDKRTLLINPGTSFEKDSDIAGVLIELDYRINQQDSDLYLRIDGGSLFLHNGKTNTVHGEFIYDSAAGALQLNAPRGNFTVDALGDIILDADGNDIIFKNGAGGDTVTHTLANDGNYIIASPNNYTIDTVSDIILDADGGNITFKDAGVTDYNFATDGTVSRTGDLVLDVSGDITLDADGNDIRFKNGAGGDEVVHTLADNGDYTITSPANYTVDTVGDIILDAAGDNIVLKDDGNIRVTYTLGATTDISIGGSLTTNVGGSIFDSAGTSIQTVSGTTTTHTVGTNYTLTAGGNSVVNITGSIDEDAGTTIDRTAGTNISDTAITGSISQTSGTTFTQTSGDNFTTNVTGEYLVDVSGDITLDADGNDIIFKNGAGGDTVTHTLADDANYTITVPNNYTIDAVGDITLDADGNNIRFDDGATTRVRYDLGATNVENWTGNLTRNVSGSILDSAGTTLTHVAGTNIVQTASTGSYALTTGTTIAQTSGTTFTQTSGTTFTQTSGDNFTTNVTGEYLVDASGNITLDADGGNVTIKDAGTTQFDFIAGANKEIDVPSGNLTLDVDGNINLNADTGLIRLYDAAIEFGRFTNTSDNLVVYSPQDNADIIFNGKDDGAIFTALTLDMSDSGSAIFSHDIYLPDNGRVVFGAGSDLQIYHDGSHSYVSDQGTGNLVLKGNNFRVYNAAEDKLMFAGNNGGVSYMYYDGSVRIATSDTGAAVTGTVTFGDGHTIGDDSFDNLVIASSTAENIILNANDAGVTVKGDTQFLVETEFGTDRFKVDTSTGDISFYDSDGTTAKMTWDASSETLNFADNSKAIFGDGSDLQIYHDGSNSYITEAGTGNLYIQYNDLFLQSNTGENYIYCNNDAEVVIYYDDAPKLTTTATGVDVTGTLVSDGLTVDTATGSASPTPSKITIATSTSASDWSTTAPWGRLAFYSADASAGGAKEEVTLDVISAQAAGGVADFTINTYNSGAKERFRISHDGDISFYEDTGTTPKFFWDASAESLGIGTTSPLTSLWVQGASLPHATFANDDFVTNTAGSTFDITMGATTGATYTSLRSLTAGRSTWGNLILQQGGGRVGIGTNLPSVAAHAVGKVRAQKTGQTNAYVQLSAEELTSNYAADIFLNDTGLTFKHNSASRGFVFDQNGSERMRIDSSGFVGIGTDSPATVLSIHNSADKAFLTQTNPANTQKLEIGNAFSLYSGANGAVSAIASDAVLAFATADSEAMRIDASGNLLVGTTSIIGTTDTTGEGHDFRATGAVLHKRDGGIVQYLNRLTSDGDIVDFRKDGSPVGSIGVTGSDLTISSSVADHSGLRFALNNVLPMKNGSIVDAAIDLGQTTVTNYRFKDLHLSGQVNANTVNLLSTLKITNATPEIQLFETDGTINQNINMFVDDGGFYIAELDDNGVNEDRLFGVLNGGDVNFYDSDGVVDLSWNSSNHKLSFPDNTKAIFGDGSDLQIYHDTEHSFIKDAGTGHLKIQAANLKLQDVDGNNYIDCIDGSYVRLMHNTATKLETTATGVDVTGTVTADGLTVETASVVAPSTNATFAVNVSGGTSLTSTISQRAKSSNGANAETSMVVTGSAGEAISSWDFKADTTNGALTKIMTLDGNGDISFYEDTGTAPKFQWLAGDEKLIIDGNGSSVTSLATTVSESVLELNGNSTNGSDALYFGAIDSGGVNYIQVANGAGTTAYDLVLNPYGGNVGIGTTSPVTGAGYANLTLNGNSGGQVHFTDNGVLKATITSSVNDLYVQSGSQTIFRNGGFTGGDESMRIDANGNVGIGTDSPSSLQAGAENLVVGSGSGDEGITIYSGAANRGNIYFADGTTGSDPYRGQINYFHDSDYLRFVTAATERMRIDASGNLLIGKTVSDATTDGIQARGIGSISIARSAVAGDPLLVLNKKTNDGTIAEFRKDGEEVGSIGVNNGTNLYIGAEGQTGLKFGSTDIVPADANNSGASSDADMNLGNSITRFKDLHLSGTGYLPSVDIDSGSIVGLTELGSIASPIITSTIQNLTVTNLLTAPLISPTTVSFNDYISGTNSNVITFGNDSDMVMYHDGSNSYINHKGTGDLRILADSFRIRNAANNSNMIIGSNGGAVTLYHNGNSKLVTTSTGVTVTGLLTADTKSFTIDHPTKEGMKLRYGSLEGPEHGVYVRGRLSGTNTIVLPEVWVGLVDEDTITVNLTSIGKGECWIENIENNTVTVGGHLNCFYMVQAERKDVEKLIVEFPDVG